MIIEYFKEIHGICNEATTKAEQQTSILIPEKINFVKLVAACAVWSSASSAASIGISDSSFSSKK